jgi:hypothetical protein
LPATKAGPMFRARPPAPPSPPPQAPQQQQSAP